MAERQERKLLAAMLERDKGIGIADLEKNIAVGEHRTLGWPRGT